METFAGLPVYQFETQKQWRAWLDKHHTQTSGVWLKIAKKATGIATVTYAEALDEALCYGWIDGQKNSYDGDYFLQRFTPRRPKSIWSKINIAKVAALTEAGKMKPGGLAAVTAAKADGRWAQAYDSHSTSTVPADFQAALDRNQQAKEFFATLNKTNTYAFLWRIQTAKKPVTRQARIEKFITMLANGEKLH
jgi:uncharacterized protein YdeI (YjbR/CyaY-like superfamily)